MLIYGGYGNSVPKKLNLYGGLQKNKISNLSKTAVTFFIESGICMDVIYRYKTS
jgi:hypothetical protein